MRHAGKMADAAAPVRGLGHFSRVVLFLSQFYVLSGGGELKAGGRAGSGWGDGGSAICESIVRAGPAG